MQSALTLKQDANAWKQKLSEREQWEETLVDGLSNEWLRHLDLTLSLSGRFLVFDHGRPT
jgi:hypothetical protein